MSELDRRVFVAFAAADLRRLDRYGGRLDGIHFKILGQLAEPRFDNSGLHITHDNKNQVVRHIHFFVVAKDFVPSDAVVNIRITDDRMSVGVGEKRRVPLQPVGPASGIIDAHGHLAEDDFFFLEQFVGRDGGVHHAVGQNFHRWLPVFRRQVDVVNRLLEGRIGVHVATGAFDRVGDVADTPGGGAFKQHVFEHVGDAGAQVLAFGDTAGPAPRLRTDNRRAVVFADQDGQAVIKDGFADGLGGEGRFCCHGDRSKQCGGNHEAAAGGRDVHGSTDS